MEGNIGKKRTDRVAGRASSHSTSLSCNKSVVPDWLNTYLPHNYSLPSKSPVCLCARYIKHICHGSPSPSPLVATAHALFLTFMMEDGWMKKGPPSTKKKSTLRCDMGQRPPRQQNVVIKSSHQSQLLLSVPSLWSLFLYQDIINFFFNCQRGLPEIESMFLEESTGCLPKQCPGAGESAERKACSWAYSSCKEVNKSSSKFNRLKRLPLQLLAFLSAMLFKMLRLNQ